jgi:DNA-binding NarL/FixJ family response regulator
MKQLLPNLSTRGTSHLPTLVIALPDIMYAEMISEWNFDCQFRTLAVIDDGINFVNKMRTLNPDFLLIDSELPHFNGFHLAENLKNLKFKTKVIIYASKRCSDYLQKYLDGSKHNIQGFIHKGCGVGELERCLRNVFEGRKYLSDNVSNYMNETEKQAIKGSFSEEKLSALANREMDVWNLLTQGRTEKEIGDYLNIGIATVKTYKKRIKDKLDLIGKGKLTYLALNSSIK